MNMIKGFTLTELLIIIAILAILAVSVAVVLNPIELLAQARDSRRVGEFNGLAKTIGLHASSVIGGYRGTANRVYISLPDSLANCGNLTASLPALPTGWEYRCSTIANFRRSDGTGWLPHNFNAMRGGSPFNELPVDPVNNTTHYYTYVTGTGWALSSLLESNRHLRTSALRDGGTDPGRLEIGTNLGIWTSASGLVGYWAFDEGGGTITNDSSGHGNNGTRTAGTIWQSATNCKLGSSCLQFPGGQVVTVPDNSILDIPNNLTILMWFQASALNPSGLSSHPITKWSNTVDANFTFYYCGTACGSNNRMMWWANRGGTWGAISANSPTLTINDWVFVGLTYQNGGQFYWNGLAVNPITGSGNLAINNQPLRIGNTGAVGDNTYIIDEVRIYNRALSPAEINAIYNATK